MDIAYNAVSLKTVLWVASDKSDYLIKRNIYRLTVLNRRSPGFCDGARPPSAMALHSLLIVWAYTVLAGAPSTVTDKLQRVLNTAARVVTGTQKFDRGLARRRRPGVLQAGSDSSSVSERPRTTVPVGLLRPGRQCWQSAVSAFRQPSTMPTCSTSLPAQHLRLSGLFICRAHSLELSPGFYLGPDCQCRLFQTFASNVFVRSILVRSAR